MLYLVVIQAPGASVGSQNLLLLALAYVGIAVAGLAVVRFSLLKFRHRLKAAVALDQVLFALALYLGGELAAPMVWAPIITALSSGMLGGMAYAKAASLIGAALLSCAFALSPFWSAIPLVSAGIVLATVLIPWHSALLAGQIIGSRNEMRRRAAELQIASMTDSLTGALNRAGFLAALDKHRRATTRNGIKTALMLLDLDGFKAVNDWGGHALGDRLLQEIVQQLRQSLRASDHIGRLGGDEFGILAGHLSGGQDAERLAHKILCAIASVRLPGHEDLQVTGSIGILLLPASPELSVADLLEQADRLMYEAKRAGKNQYRTSFEPALRRLRAQR